MSKYNLTNEQLDELIEQYVDIKVDRMSHKDLEEHVTQDLNDYYSDWSIDELETIIDSELFDELVNNVTTTTYSLNVNESISFPAHPKKSS